MKKNSDTNNSDANSSSGSNQDPSRREFVKSSALGILGAIVAAKIVTRGVPAFAAEEAVKESDPMAQSLGYKTDAKKVDTKKFPKRAGADGAKQFCYSCQFYQAKGDAKASKSAPCTIFQNKIVQHSGWCNTWTQNPKVTV